MYELLIEFIRDQYPSLDTIPLHAPQFVGNERNYVLDSIDSTFVSSVGRYVTLFEESVATYTNSPRAVATVNGTAALHMALLLVGVEPGDLVITQALTFIATCNAIKYCGADPVFVDVDKATLGLSPNALSNWLDEEAIVDDSGVCRHKNTGRIIRACVPVHTFGHPVDLDALIDVCQRWRLALVEDAAESLGSYYKGRHTGTIGLVGALSFNGNKIITTGGGGMLLTNDNLGTKAKHLTTTAKVPHPYEFVHDSIGYNYRLPNLNAALGVAQMEVLSSLVEDKRLLALSYAEILSNTPFCFVKEPVDCQSNYWLNAVICDSLSARDTLLETTNRVGIMTRPIWRLMHRLPMYADSLRGDLSHSDWLADRVVNLPSSVRSREFFNCVK